MRASGPQRRVRASGRPSVPPFLGLPLSAVPTSRFDSTPRSSSRIYSILGPAQQGGQATIAWACLRTAGPPSSKPQVGPDDGEDTRQEGAGENRAAHCTYKRAHDLTSLRLYSILVVRKPRTAVLPRRSWRKWRCSPGSQGAIQIAMPLCQSRHSIGLGTRGPCTVRLGAHLGVDRRDYGAEVLVHYIGSEPTKCVYGRYELREGSHWGSPPR